MAESSLLTATVAVAECWLAVSMSVSVGSTSVDVGMVHSVAEHERTPLKCAAKQLG